MPLGARCSAWAMTLASGANTGHYALVSSWSDHPRWGSEFDWFAVDEGGHVGVFSTAGYGPVPSAVLKHVAELDAYYNTWRDAISLTGRCVDRPLRPGDFNDWISAAERGLYGFDWTIWAGPYERVTVPSHPLNVDELPRDLRRLATVVSLAVDFGTATTVPDH